jgi:hypothetical protein
VSQTTIARHARRSIMSVLTARFVAWPRSVAAWWRDDADGTAVRRDADDQIIDVVHPDPTDFSPGPVFSTPLRPLPDDGWRPIALLPLDSLATWDPNGWTHFPDHAAELAENTGPWLAELLTCPVIRLRSAAQRWPGAKREAVRRSLEGRMSFHQPVTRPPRTSDPPEHASRAVGSPMWKTGMVKC